MKVGAYTVAVGSGGIDGDIVNLRQAVNLDFLYVSPILPQEPTLQFDQSGPERTTKISYYSPIFGGAQFGLSYAPDSATVGDGLATRNDTILERDRDGKQRPFSLSPPAESYDDITTAGVAYSAAMGPVAFRTSVVGIVDPHRITDRWVAYWGAVINAYDFSIGGGLGWRRQKFEPRDDDGTRINGNSRFFSNIYNLGVAYKFDRYSVSLNWGRVRQEDEHGSFGTVNLDDYVFGIEVGLLPGLVLSNEVAYYAREDVDFREGRREVLGVARLAIAF